MSLELENMQHYLTCEDHLLSGEKFDLLYQSEYDLLVTSPKPDHNKLPEYYKSNAYISHTDSSKTWFDKAYQWAKQLMLKKKCALLEKYHKEKGTILDLGSGTGDFLKAANNDHWKIYGVEPNEKARTIAAEKNIFLEPESTNFNDSQFDVITMWHVLEHVPDLENQLQELDRLLKKDGTLFIAVPNFKSYDAKHYQEFWAAYDVPRHLWHFSKKSISTLFAKHQFELIATLPLKFDSYYVSLLSEKNKTGSIHYFRALLTGLRSNLKARSSKEYSSHIYVLKRR